MADDDVDLDDFDLHEDDDFETIPCSFKYVRVCLLLPAVNGFLNAFLWPAYTLYFEEMGWPLVRAGLAVSVGFGSRVFMQQLQLRTGYWLIVPLSAVHLIIVVFSLIFQTSEWAVFAQLVVWLGIDPTCAIEGIAFDSFGDSEAQARQATSTVLSVFTIAFACSCTFGGILYDSAGWTGIALYHIILQGAMTLLLAVEPACRQSFRAVFFPGSEDETLAAQAQQGDAQEVFTQVVPKPSTEQNATSSELPGVVEDMKVEDVEEVAEAAEAAEVAEGEKKASLEPDQTLLEGQNGAELPAAGDPVVDPSGSNHRMTTASAPSGPRDTVMANSRASNVSVPRETFMARNRASIATRNTQMTEGRMTQMTRNTEVTVMTESQERKVQLLRRGEAVRRAQMARGSQVTGVTAVTGATFGTFATFASKATSDKKINDRLSRAKIWQTVLTKATGKTQQTGHSGGSGGTGRSKKTGRSARTGLSRMTALTALSRMTALSQAGQHFRHHFACQAVLPEIIGARGGEGVLREEVDAVDENGSVVEAPVGSKKASIPKDVRLPAFFIVMNSFCNTCAYILEYATFAIFFKQVHNWNNATFAGLTQMAGDVLGAIVMQVIPLLMNNDYDPDELGCFRRYCHYLLSKPYTLSITLSTWVLFNLGMVSPSLPVAITAQIFMGTTFVYSCKWSTDMNLYYSLGDSQVFLSLQVLCRNADAIGGSIAGVLATWLFSIDPAAPFIFGTGMACLIFIMYTLGFCARLGFGADIERAEEMRSRRLGVKRVSSWRNATKDSS